MQLDHNHQPLPASKSEIITPKPPINIQATMTNSELLRKPTDIDIIQKKFLTCDEDAVRFVNDQLKYVKRCIDTQFTEFSQKLVNLMRHHHLIGFAKQTGEDIAGILSGAEKDEQLLHRMKEYPLKADSFYEAFENCKFELKLAQDKLNFINFNEVCPTGRTLINRFEQTIDRYFTIEPSTNKKDEKSVVITPPVFQIASTNFREEEYRNIESLLEQTGHKLKHVSLIFRASEHGFRSKAFKQICSKMEKTLVVVKSTHERIFGGYTPCKWLDTKEKEYIADTKRQSFLFSVDEKMVFPIRAHQIDYAISTYGSWGPIFGSPYGPDLSLSDQCHLNDHSCSSLGSHYQIPLSVKEFSNEAFCLLAGSKKFKVVEYEVFEVEFE